MRCTRADQSVAVYARLAEQVFGRGSHDPARISVTAAITVTPNYTSGNGVPFSADQARDTGKFISDAFLAGVHRVTVTVALAAVVVNGLHAGNADGDFVQTFAPGAAEAVGDDHGNVQRRALLELLQDARRRPVRIERQQHGGLASVDIGDVDAAVGTDQAVSGFGDQYVLLAYDTTGLAQGQLGVVAAVFMVKLYYDFGLFYVPSLLISLVGTVCIQRACKDVVHAKAEG